MPLRDRPVLEHIVEQHAEEAAFLWTQRDAATDAPHYKRHHLARLDERVEAHVDGLRVAGEAGWRIALEQLEWRCEKGELFAAGILALESGDMRRIEPLVALAANGFDTRRGLVGALAWCEPGLLGPKVQIWHHSWDPFHRYLALCAHSVHRAAAGDYVRAGLEDEDALVRARALRLAGELGCGELLASVLAHSGETEPASAFWAAWSAVLLGERRLAIRVLADIARQPYNWCEPALEVVGRAAGHDAGRRLMQDLDQETPFGKRLVTMLAGHVGDPADVPWLIAYMENTKLARLAGQSVSMITGIDLALRDLDSVNLNTFGASPSDASDDENMAPDLDFHLPWPDLAAVTEWWKANRHSFQPGHRYLLGRPARTSGAAFAWAEGYQTQRRAAAYELSPEQRQLLSWKDRIIRPRSQLRVWRSSI